MKQLTVVIFSVVMMAAMAHGQISVGGHGAYTVGGDVEENRFGFGAQAALALNDAVSVELSGTRYSDAVNDDDLDITQLALTGRIGADVTEGLRVYGGGGASYILFDDVAGISVDNAIGYHVAGGATIALNHSLELFAEYRFNWVDVDVSSMGFSDTLDFDYGLVRTGLNLVL